MKFAKRSIAAFLSLIIVIGSLCVIPVSAAEAADEYDGMRLKLYNRLLGKDYNPEDAWTKPITAAITDEAMGYWDTMNKSPVSNAVNGSYRDENDVLLGVDSSKDYLWEERPLGKRGTASGCWYESNNTQWAYIHLKAMAVAYKTVGSELFGNRELLADIKMGLKFLYDHHFNPNVIKYGNWYSWELGSPMNLGEIMVMLYDELTPDEITDYATVLTKYLGKNPAQNTGANGLWARRVWLYAGILLKDKAWLDHMKSSLPNFYKYAAGKDGYYTDGTFIQHETLPYNNGYGISCLSDSAFLLYMLSGTQWDMGSSYYDIIYRWLYDSYETVVYDGLAMDSFRGREITRESSGQAVGGISIASTLLMMSENAPEDIRNDFLGMVKQWFSNSYMKEQLNQSGGSALNIVPQVDKILADDSIAPRKLVKNVQMNVGARTVHHAEDYAYEIAMTSKRINSYEGGDSNVKGWYTGNGMTYLYNGDMSRYEGTVKPTIDWYRMPGATAVYGKSQGQTLNSKSFVGGTSLNSLYGTTGMDFEVSANKLKMKKSWFQFKDAIVALGSDISGTGQVETTLENYVLDSDNRTFSVNGAAKTMSMDGQQGALTNVKTLHIDGNTEGADIGFYFPNSTNLSYKSETRSGKFSDYGASNSNSTVYSRDYFTVWQAHGANPTNAGYSYVLLPNKSDAELTSYAEANTIEILQNDSRAHAVYEKALDVVGVNFWEDGSNILSAKGVPNYLYSDRAASIMVGENNDGIDISVSDSTWENNGFIHVEINRAAAGVLSADEGVEVLQTSPTIKLKINVKNAKGKNFSTRLSYVQVPPQSPEIQSVEMVDDALVVSMDSVGAGGYEVRYGAASGAYTDSVSSSKNVIHIYGLTPGETYYLAAVSKTGGAESGPSGEKSFTVPLTVQFVDEFADMSKMLDYSDGWNYEGAGNAGAFGGDLTRLWRGKDTHEYFTYMIPALQDFAIEYYGYDKKSGTILVSTSADGVDWQTQACKVDGTPVNQWYKQVLTPDGGVNAGANYIKVELSNHAKGWAPQFTKFTAAMRNNCEQKLIKDPLLNDQRMYAASHVEFIKNNGDGLFGGDHDLLAPMDADNELLYSWTNITDAVICAYAKSGGLTVSSSADGVQFAPVALSFVAGDTDAGGYKAFTCASEGLPQGTNYLKIKLDPEVVLGEVELEYKPANTPIQKIRFVDDALDGVIGYDATPELRAAPMNGISELLYSTVHENLAAYSGGALSFRAQGNTKAMVTVAGTDITAELPLTIYKNLALKQKASASSSNSLYPPALGVDGNISTGWQSGNKEAEWFAVDMGADVTFDAVDIIWSSKGKEYSIQTSKDGVVYTPVLEVTDASEGGGRETVRHTFDTPQTARFIRMQGRTPYQYNITEFRVLQKDGVEPDDAWNLALGKAVTASSVDSSDTGLKASLAVDGDTTSRWGSNRTDDEWFMVDLGETSKVAAVNILWETACGKAYKIQISDDKKAWADMVSETGGTEGWMRYSLNTLYSGRYVRMQGIKRATKYGYSIYEFEVMGTNATGSKVNPIKTITLEPESLTLLKGQSYILSAKTDKTVTPASIKWESSDPNVITVGGGGRLTAVGTAGSAVITASSVLNETVQAACTVSVAAPAGKPKPVESMRITEKPEGELGLGDTFTMKAAITPETATNKTILWQSSDPSVAVINAAGKLTAVGPGQAVITARSVASGQTDTYTLNVVNNNPFHKLTVAKPAAGSAKVTTNPAGKAQAGSQVTVDVADIEDGYLYKALNVTCADGSIGLKEITEDVPEGVKRFAFIMPAAPATVTLLLKADTSGLEGLIKTAEGKDQKAYTEESWQALKNALAQARLLLLETSNAGKADVDRVVKRLKDALDGLEKVTEETLAEIIAEAEGLDETYYTVLSWAQILQALDAAKRADETDPAAVSAAIKALRKALDQKAEVPAGSGDLNRDGRVNVSDVMAACKILARKSGGILPSDSEIRLGDLTGDKDVDISDVMRICKILANQA